VLIAWKIPKISPFMSQEQVQTRIFKGMGDALSAIFLNSNSSFLSMSSNIKASPAVNSRLIPSELRINTPVFVT